MNAIGLIILMLLFKAIPFNAQICKDISEERKETIYKEFDAIYRKYTNQLILAKINPLNMKTDIVNPDLYRKKGDCKKVEQNSTYVNERALCPWEYRLRIRANHTLSNKYPLYRKEAHCMCEKCDGRIKFNRMCIPVMEPMPCLVRQENCGSDGYYRWMPQVELVSVACVCADISRIIV